MTIKARSLAAAVGAIVFATAPAMAQAERVYFLVGVRHIYSIGPNRDAHLQEREEIEKDYADGVAQDQDTFDKHVADGADKEKESEELDGALGDLAKDRDQRLGAIFENRDDLRESHPQLQIQGDGPYQVMGIEMHRHNNVVVFDNFEVFAPWPGYVPVGGFYGGWHFGVVYTPIIFFGLYSTWHSHWGGGPFYGGFYGHHGPVVFEPRGFVGHFGRPGGFRSAGGFGRVDHVVHTGGYAHGSFARPGGGYAHGGSFGHAAGSYSRPGGYSHGAGSFGHTSNGFSRSATGYSHGSTEGHRSFGSTSHGSFSGGHSSSTHSFGSSHSHSGGSSHSDHHSGGHSGGDHDKRGH